MIFCLDTDILIEYFRGNEKIRDRIEALSDNDSIGLTWLSFYEFFKGIFVSGKIEEEKFLRKLFDSSVILEASYQSAKIGGEIYASLKKRGQLINDADILIASIVKSRAAVLVTNNVSHFSRIEGLKIENWMA
ncbi:MAG: PIN domain-containing protein [Deltaproteobacteria bacterium]|nr:PIN domain-containing protein [Deltaproteobacteria bacterium]